MSIAEPERLYTPEDLLTLPDVGHFELIDGRLVEKSMGSLASYVAAQLMSLLGPFVKQHKLGFTFDSDGGYQCFPNNRVRKPDLSFVQNGRLPGNRIPRGHIPLPPDLAVEVISPSDVYYEVDVKIDEYLHAGIRLIWVVNPELRTILVYRANGSVTRLIETGELDGEDVIPGFRYPAAELFAINE